MVAEAPRRDHGDLRRGSAVPTAGRKSPSTRQPPYTTAASGPKILCNAAAAGSSSRWAVQPRETQAVRPSAWPASCGRALVPRLGARGVAHGRRRRGTLRGGASGRARFGLAHVRRSPATMPRFDPATWRLRINGLVGAPQSLSYEELRALPSAQQVSTFHCVTGWTVSNVQWRAA